MERGVGGEIGSVQDRVTRFDGLCSRSDDWDEIIILKECKVDNLIRAKLSIQ